MGGSISWIREIIMGDKGGLVTASYFDEDLEVFLKEMIFNYDATRRSAQGVV